MKVLILSCSTGQGHNSCAQAIKQCYDLRGDTCEIEDTFRFISPLFSRFMSWGHATMYKHFPWLFRVGYRFSERHPVLFWKKSGIYSLFSLGTERLCNRIVSGGFDAVICTHAFAAVMLTDALRTHSLRIATCLVNTDYTCNPCTKDSDLDLYFIPDQSLASAFECETIGRSKIRIAGIPLRREFYRRVPRQQAKEACGIPKHHTHLLVMCGSMGCGPMKRLAREFACADEPDVDITIVCGTNARLERMLSRRYEHMPRIHVRGYVENVSLLMDSADICLTKPGGISITEAAAKSLPMILVDAVAGCEEYNQAFFVHNGGAKSAESLDELVCITKGLLSSQKSERNAMRKNLESLSTKSSPEAIYDQVRELLEKSAPIRRQTSQAPRTSKPSLLQAS